MKMEELCEMMKRKPDPKKGWFIIMMDKKGKTRYVRLPPRSTRSVPSPEGMEYLELFCHRKVVETDEGLILRPAHKREVVTLSDARTGLSITVGDNCDDALARLERYRNMLGFEKIESLVHEALSKGQISPRYTDEPAENFPQAVLGK